MGRYGQIWTALDGRRRAESDADTAWNWFFVLDKKWIIVQNVQELAVVDCEQCVNSWR